MTITQCRHYWLIEPPDGITSTGRCKFCQESKEFYNDVPTQPHGTAEGSRRGGLNGRGKKKRR